MLPLLKPIGINDKNLLYPLYQASTSQLFERREMEWGHNDVGCCYFMFFIYGKVTFFGRTAFSYSAVQPQNRNCIRLKLERMLVTINTL